MFRFLRTLRFFYAPLKHGVAYHLQPHEYAKVLNQGDDSSAAIAGELMLPLFQPAVDHWLNNECGPWAFKPDREGRRHFIFMDSSDLVSFKLKFL